MDEEPKQRYITIDFHILAYLGDFIKVFEAGVRHSALAEYQPLVKQEAQSSIPVSSNQKHQAQSPGGR
jgi:23S rRNA maturation mini-RNase III